MSESGAAPRQAARSHLVALLTLLGVGVAAALLVHRFWSRELSHLTGDARWMWTTDSLERVHPVAGLFVASLELEAEPTSALLKVCGDREYVVYVNGTPAACGWSRPGFYLDLYDVGHLLHQGTNVVGVEVRSPTPAGGVLLALDVEGVGENLLVSGDEFVLRQPFSLVPPGEGDLPVPVAWGAPPRFPWGYPVPKPRPRTLDTIVVEEPIRLEISKAKELLRGGWAFELPRPLFAYLWIEIEKDGLVFAETSPFPSADGDAFRSLAQPVARVRGQVAWLDPEPKVIGSVYVFGSYRPRAIELWPVPEELRPAAPGVVQGKHGLVPRTRWTTRTPPG